MLLYDPAEDKNHCDFLALRSLVLAHHMQDLKDVTSLVHYEKYRCNKLTAMALNKEVIWNDWRRSGFDIL